MVVALLKPCIRLLSLLFILINHRVALKVLDSSANLRRRHAFIAEATIMKMLSDPPNPNVSTSGAGRDEAGQLNLVLFPIYVVHLLLYYYTLLLLLLNCTLSIDF